MRYEAASWSTKVGHCQAGAVALLEYAATWGITNDGCYNDRPVRGSSEPSLHREGRAVDLHATTRCQEMVNHLIANYETFGIQQIIWQARSWRCDRTGDKWRPYSGEDLHYGHAHVELTWEAAARNTIETYQEQDMTDDQIDRLAAKIAAAIMNYPVNDHNYDTNTDDPVPLHAAISYAKQELTLIRRQG